MIEFFFFLWSKATIYKWVESWLVDFDIHFFLLQERIFIKVGKCLHNAHSNFIPCFLTKPKRIALAIATNLFGNLKEEVLANVVKDYEGTRPECQSSH